MQFWQHQRAAQLRTLQLFGGFAVLLLLLAGFVNLFLALLWRILMPAGAGWPALFFETNTALIVLFVIGGSLVELQRLRAGGGPRVARWLGGQPVQPDDTGLHRRLLNVVDEMALASGQPTPQVHVLPREDAINAFVAGWGPQDLVLCVTRGALERLTRAELQGLVAHEFGHIREDDLPLTMRMLALVWGLSLVHGYGQALMAADEQGRVNPLRWLLGLVFAGVGWLGWLAGRALQAAVSRQREFLADACAIQFTRTRDGLGNVLRKVWHDEQVLAGRMQHPAAEMIASLLMHQPDRSTWLSTHPPLPERIRRVCGSALPPLPAPLLRTEVTEARHAPSVPPDALQPAPDPQAEARARHQERLAADREALAHLQHLHGPTELRLMVLALLMDPHNRRECRLWARLAESVHDSSRIQANVAALLPARRVPEFERVTELIGQHPLEARRMLAEQARDLLRADGRVSPRDRLWWLALRHRIGVGKTTQALMRPITGQGQELSSALSAEQQRHVVAMSAYLARILPQEERVEEPGPSLPSQQWFDAVLCRLGIAAPASALQTPDADALVHALSVTQELSWMLRPQLIKAWVEEAVNHSPQGLMSDPTADALRLMARLLDAPMPPMLEAHYRQA